MSAPKCAKYLDELREVANLEDDADDFAIAAIAFLIANIVI